MFDWTISVGNIIQIGTFIGTCIWMFLSMRSDIRVIRHDLSFVEKGLQNLNEAFSQLGTILTQVAVQDNRLGMMEKAVDELRHGQGFIKKP